MPSLSEKLKSLGVTVGVGELTPLRSDNKQPREGESSHAYAIEKVLDGSYTQTPQGEIFTVEARYPEGQAHGRASLAVTASLKVLAEWANDARIQALPAQAFAFLDTETTGLSGGTGTYAFLIGVGRFEEGEFRLAQFFLRDPIEEPAQLAALEAFLAPCQAMVTFNGKAFDAPLLSTRYLTHGWRPPLADLVHVDLLHLARRLWRERLPSRTLSNLEAHILGALRSQEDLPGWMIPGIYFDYLRDGDARSMKRVFYHNAMDVLSLAALLDHMAHLLIDPIHLGGKYSVDLIALARLFEDLGDIDTASTLYLHGLEHEDARTDRLPMPVLLQALQRLALIYKRRADWSAAIQLWEQAARHQHLHAHLELAKCYEHSFKDYMEAIRWTQSAIDLIEDVAAMEGYPTLASYERRQWLEGFQHRLARLQRKLSGQ